MLVWGHDLWPVRPYGTPANADKCLNNDNAFISVNGMVPYILPENITILTHEKHVCTL